MHSLQTGKKQVSLTVEGLQVVHVTGKSLSTPSVHTELLVSWGSLNDVGSDANRLGRGVNMARSDCQSG